MGPYFSIVGTYCHAIPERERAKASATLSTVQAKVEKLSAQMNVVVGSAREANEHDLQDAVGLGLGYFKYHMLNVWTT